MNLLRKMVGDTSSSMQMMAQNPGFPMTHFKIKHSIGVRQKQSKNNYDWEIIKPLRPMHPDVKKQEIIPTKINAKNKKTIKDTSSPKWGMIYFHDSAILNQARKTWLMSKSTMLQATSRLIRSHLDSIMDDVHDQSVYAFSALHFPMQRN